MTEKRTYYAHMPPWDDVYDSHEKAVAAHEDQGGFILKLDENSYIVCDEYQALKYRTEEQLDFLDTEDVLWDEENVGREYWNLGKCSERGNPLLWNHKTRKFERYVWRDQR